MTFEDQKWRELCRKAMLENDVNKVLNIFVELDRATEQEHAPVEATREHTETKLGKALRGE